MTGEYKRKGTVEEVLAVTSLGGGLKKVKEELVEFNHDRAEWLLELEEFVGDRKLKQPHVDYLVRVMMRGTFHPEWVTLIVCDLDGTTYRMNGQHTAWARLEMPKKWACRVRLLRYRAKTLEDMRTLYASVDRSSPRTRSNVMKSYLAGCEEFKDLKSRPLRLLPQGFSFWQWESATKRSTFDGDDISYLLRTDFYDIALKVGMFLNEYANPKTYVFIQRQPVIAAMFATFNKTARASVEFWDVVCSGVGIEKATDPRLKLRNELMQTGLGQTQAGKKTMSQEAMYRMCLFAWRAFREGREVRALYRTSVKGKRPAVR